eukprot:4148855-Amphidinium_carterae.4
MTKPTHHTWSTFTLKDGLDRRYKVPRQDPAPPWITEPYKDNKLTDPNVPPWTKHKSYTPRQDPDKVKTADTQPAEVIQQTLLQNLPKPPPPVQPLARVIHVEPSGHILPPPGSAPRPNGKGFMRVPTPPKRAGCALLVAACCLSHGIEVYASPSGDWRPTNYEDAATCLAPLRKNPAGAERGRHLCVPEFPGGDLCKHVMRRISPGRSGADSLKCLCVARTFACLNWTIQHPKVGRNLPCQLSLRGGMHLFGTDSIEYRRALLAQEHNPVAGTPPPLTPVNVCLLHGSNHYYNLARLEVVDWFAAEEDPPTPQSDYAPIPLDRTPGEILAAEEIGEALADPLNRCVIDGSRQYYNMPRLETVDWFAAEEPPSPEEYHHALLLPRSPHEWEVIEHTRNWLVYLLERSRAAPGVGRTPIHGYPQRGGGHKRARTDTITSEIVLNPTPADNPCCLFVCLCKLIGKPTDRAGVDELRLQIANQIAHRHSLMEPVATWTLSRWASAMGFDNVRSLIHATHIYPLRPGSRLDLHLVHEFTGASLWVLDHLGDVLFAIGRFTPSFALRLENSCTRRRRKPQTKGCVDTMNLVKIPTSLWRALSRVTFAQLTGSWK